MRVGLVVCASFAAIGVASAQPLDPYAPRPAGPVAPPARPPAPPAPRAADPVLAEQLAAALVARAQELFDANLLLDAKQLAIEAQVKSPRGAAADQARFLIKAINGKLGIVDDTPAVELAPVPLTPKRGAVDRYPDGPDRPSQITSGVHGALYFGLLGATAGSFIGEEPATGGVALGVAAGVAAGLYVPRRIVRSRFTEGQVRTVGSASVWGGMVGGLAGDLGKTSGSTSRHVLIGASIGSTAALLGGVALARQDRYTPGDIALVDTFAGIGAIGGLTIGMLMQPVQTEAYSLNSMLGATAGVITGLVAGPQTNTTPRRMVRVAGAASLGAAAPFVLYAAIYDSSSAGDERTIGALSSIGLLAGAYVGFRLTRDLDRGLDLNTRQHRDDDAVPPAVLGRSATGQWSMGALTLQPLSRQLAPQPGMSLPVLAGSW
ncbi:MAG: hypothetical protein WKG01_26210 [Kofleriaceae bacterium]